MQDFAELEVRWTDRRSALRAGLGRLRSGVLRQPP